MHGQPGNGKTITIKALIATLMDNKQPVPTLYIKSTKDSCKGDQSSIQLPSHKRAEWHPVYLSSKASTVWFKTGCGHTS